MAASPRPKRISAKHGVRGAALPGVAGYAVTGAAPTASELLGNEFRAHREQRMAERISYVDWLRKVPEPKAGPLDMHRFPFQVGLYTEKILRAEEVVVRKATQVGVSAWLVRQLLYWTDVRGATSIYVFPNQKLMYDFSIGRVKLMIGKSPWLTGRIGEVDSRGMRQVGAGIMYFRGSEAVTDLESVDADVVGLDEYDRLAQINIPVVENRISGPNSLGLMRRVGVPIVPNTGISKLWNETDRRRWFVRCPGCGERQYLTWVRNVDQERLERICGGCKAPLAPDTIREGEWVAEHPEADTPGFHINKLIVPDLRRSALRKMVLRSQSSLPEDVQGFWNMDMGEGYAPAEGRLSDEALAAAVSAGEQHGSTARAESYVGLNMVTMGVDVHSVRNLYVRVSEWIDTRRKRALMVKQIEDFDEIAELMVRFDVRMCCIDHLPEGRLARALALKFPGRVYLVAYATAQMQSLLDVAKEEPLIKVRRTESIDATLNMIREQRNLLPPDAPPMYGEQLQAVVRIAERDHLGRRAVNYVSMGPDDYLHAENFDLLAGEMMLARTMADDFRDSSLYPLEDRLEFERSGLWDERRSHDPGDPDKFDPGPEDIYETGPDEPQRDW